MCETHALHKYYGLDDTQGKEYMEGFAYTNSPVWGLGSAGHDHLHYEENIASGILYAPTPVYSVKYFGKQTKDDVENGWGDNYIPCMLVVVTSEMVTAHEYETRSHSVKNYSTGSFPVWASIVDGTMSWVGALEALKGFELKYGVELEEYVSKEN